MNRKKRKESRLVDERKHQHIRMKTAEEEAVELILALSRMAKAIYILQHLGIEL